MNSIGTSLRRVVFLLAAVPLAVTPLPAAAWWDYAQWDLAPEQLAELSRGRIMPCNTNVPVCTVKLRNYHPAFYVDGLTFSGLSADASFAFEGGKLTRTVLRFGGDGRNARYLQSALSKIYGPPLDIKKTWMPHVLWHDNAKGSTINLIDLSPSYVLVDYGAITGSR